MRIAAWTLGAALALGLPGTAAADVVLTPYAGATFGADAEESSAQYGAAVGFLGDLVGFEVDASYTPDFFDFAGPDRDTNVTTLMGNLMLGPKFGDNDHRLYVSTGAGLMKTRVQDVDDFFDVDRNHWGMNAGGGVIVNLGQRVGLRGDVRWFRDLQDDEADNEFDVDFGNFEYWRGVGALSFRF